MNSSSMPPTPMTGYAPVNGLHMYYEVHGSSDPVVLLHDSYMTIAANFNWSVWIDELAQSRQVIAVELQGHRRTADSAREFSYEPLPMMWLPCSTTSTSLAPILMSLSEDSKCQNHR